MSSGWGGEKWGGAWVEQREGRLASGVLYEKNKKANTLLTSCLSSHLLPFLRNILFCLPSDTP